MTSIRGDIEDWETTGKVGGRKKTFSPLLTWIRKQKGLNRAGYSGEVDAFKYKESGFKGLVTKNGLTPDHMRERLEEEGVLPEGSTLNDLYNLIDEHLHREYREENYSYPDEPEEDIAKFEAEEIERLKNERVAKINSGALIGLELDEGDVLVTKTADGYEDAYRVVSRDGDEVVLKDGSTIRIDGLRHRKR